MRKYQLKQLQWRRVLAVLLIMAMVTGFVPLPGLFTVGNAVATVYVDNRYGVNYDGLATEYKAGDIIDVTGIVTEYQGAYEVKPRSAADITEKQALSLTVPAGASPGETLEIKGVLTGGEVTGKSVGVTVQDPDDAVAYVDETVTGADGSFSFTFTIPAKAAYGDWQVQVAAAGAAANGTISVGGAAGVVTATPDQVKPGATITFSGRIPQGNVAVGITVKNPAGAAVLADETTAGADGSYQFTFTVPADAPTGLWTVNAAGGGATGDATFTVGEGGDTWNLTVMHTNDTHAHLDDDKALIARRATAVGQIRAEASNSLLLDAGDVFSGTLYFTQYQGQADLEFMNMLGYDAMALGNHEFDKGPQGLAKFLTGDYAEGYKTPPAFPVLNSNFDFSAEPALSGLAQTTLGEGTPQALGGTIYPAVILDVNGEKVGLFGLTTEDTDEISSPGEQIKINDAITSAAAAVAMLEDKGINKIIAISHLGWDKDLALAQQVEGIDVVVGGHTHTTPAEYPMLVTDSQYQTPTLVVQAGEYCQYLGRLDVTFNDAGLVTGGSGELLDVDTYAPDQTVDQRLTSYRAPLEELKNTVVGSALVPLDGERGNVRTKETNLGNLIADAMLEKGAQAGAVMAITNGGGIRASIDQGEITLGEVLTVMPFGNTLTVLELTGQQIVDGLENGVSQVESAAGRFPQVAGLRFTWDPQKPAHSRIVKVEVKTDSGYQPIDRSASYLVATINFMAAGGDGYTSFEAASRVYDMGFVDYEVFMEYLQNHSPVNPQVEGRITEGSGEAPSAGKIAVFSDPHYYAPELGTTGQAFEDYLAQDRKLIAESAALARKTVDSLKASDAGIVLVTGDLTKDGELLSHQQFAALLKELEDSGKKVFVAAGNHDVNNPLAFSYQGDQTTKVDHVTPEQFKDIYHDFGYSEAIAQDPASLSFVVEPVEGLRIISMDSVLYDTNLADGKPKTEGAFSEDRLNWIKEQINDAVSQGKTVFGMMHHGLADHFTVQRQFFPEYVINDADRIADELAGAGMKVVFTGHFHAQDIVKKQTANGSVYDIETGSLVTYPCPYRIVELTADNRLNISTYRIESIDYDLGGKDFPDYARDYLVEGLNGLVPRVVAGILIKQGVPADQALQQANEKLSAPVPGGLTVKDLVVNAMASHYQGDETIDPQLLPVIQAMAGSADPLTRMIGQALLSLGTDPAPADNDVTIDFSAGPVSSADLSSLLLSEGTLAPAFAPEVTRYEAVVGNSVANLTVTPTAADSGATVRVNGNPAVSGAPFALNLAEGHNQITVSVIAGDGAATKEYVVSITRRHILPDSGRITLDNNKKNIEIPPGAQTAEITIPEGVQDATIHVSTNDNQGQKEALLPRLDVNASVRIGGAAAEIKVSVPAGTKVTGPAHWDGTIRMPEVLPNDSVQVSNGNVSAVVEIGLPDTELAFDKAVRLLITGQAGKAAGFSRGGVFTPITRTLSADTQSAADAELTGVAREGKVNAGSDLAIWTRHFTMFVAYQPTSSGGGGGGGGAPPAGQAVTARGGTVTGQGATVAVPAGAVEQTIRVKVEKVTDTSGIPLPASATLVSDVLNISKDKTGDFKKPVTITMPFDKAKADPEKQDLGIYWFSDSDKQWTILANNKVDSAAGKVSGETLHFTKFAVMATPKALQPEPVTPPAEPGAQAPAAGEPPDIAGHWARDSIVQLISAGVISGYPDGSFKPDNTVTRAEFAVMLVRVFKLAPQGDKVFADTAAHWAKNDIAAAAAHGIVSGYNDAAFGPDDLITREQMTAMMGRAAKPTATAEAASFTDSGDISGWAKASVAAAVERGLMAGYPDNTFKPGNNATRAEAATVIRNALQ